MCGAYQLVFLFSVEAENILMFERDLVSVPMGVPTPASIDEARERQEENKRLNKVHEVFI